MIKNTLKTHWENVFKTKQAHEVSWTQTVPQTSLDILHGFQLSKTAKIIDIGGGDSLLVDFLLQEGFENITVLDISKNALQRAKTRLGRAMAKKVTWIVADINDFKPTTIYDVWHDRAAFHFLTTTDEIEHYIRIATESVSGFMSIGTFSENGPTKCSGLTIKQYSELELTAQLSQGFTKLKCITENHTTPFKTEQQFLFCSFRRQELG